MTQTNITQLPDGSYRWILLRDKKLVASGIARTAKAANKQALAAAA